MHSPMTRRAVLAVTLVAAVSMGIAFRGSLPLHAQQPSNDKLKQLLEERATLVKSVAKLTRQAYEEGDASLEEVHQTQLAVLRAELDMAESQKERLSVLEKIVKLTEEHANAISAAARDGHAPKSAALTATVNRLEAEIALERARRN